MIIIKCYEDVPNYTQIRELREDVRDIKCSRYALIMGNEGNGVHEEIKNLCDKNLYIKMNSACESLNVAVATSILLYELARGHNE